MSAVDIIIPVSFIAIILKQLKYMRVLVIPTRKRFLEIIVVLFGIIVLVYIIYFYANNWIHYVTGVLGIFMFITIWIKEGIGTKGFISMYKYKRVILWNEIERIEIISSNDIKVKLYGSFMEQTFHFKKSSYDKVIGIIKENLPIQAQLLIK